MICVYNVWRSKNDIAAKTKTTNESCIGWLHKEVGENFITCFYNNEVKLDSDKCHLLLNAKEQITLKVWNLHIKNSFYKKLLEMNFDYKLNFAKCIEGICQKTSRKLNALTKLALYMASSKSEF